jgi:hypothetical protein
MSLDDHELVGDPNPRSFGVAAHFTSAYAGSSTDSRSNTPVELRFPRFFGFQRPRVMQPFPLFAEPQAIFA